MRGERSQTAYAGDRSPALLGSEFVMQDEPGVPACTKRVDGNAAGVQPFEIANARRHADALYRLAPR